MAAPVSSLDRSRRRQRRRRGVDPQGPRPADLRQCRRDRARIHPRSGAALRTELQGVRGGVAGRLHAGIWRAALVGARTCALSRADAGARPAGLCDLAAGGDRPARDAAARLRMLGLSDLRALLLLRLLRFFKLGRYSPGMASLAAALHAERKALFACFVVLMGVMLMAASLMHLVEHEAQPDKLGTIPDAMWWAIITLTTVGYGDVFPITAAGKAVAAVTAVLGLVMLALPVGIVATAFAQEIHRREFVVTWSMIASVPLFGQLDAVEIAEVMQFLRARTVKAGAVVAHAGDPLQALYFVASGEVEIAVASGKARLDEGHFFGALTLDDVAIVSHSPCVTAATATEPTKLLVLDQIDFRALTARSPKLAAHIRAKAHR
ncbi:MAG: cyclic nucleotide-binding protein [Methylobacterium sp.]|nr:cyclic nucleotide-binding protein [Methylobacterium sp.]